MYILKMKYMKFKWSNNLIFNLKVKFNISIKIIQFYIIMILLYEYYLYFIYDVVFDFYALKKIKKLKNQNR